MSIHSPGGNARDQIQNRRLIRRRPPDADPGCGRAQFQPRGFHRTTMQDVAAEAGMSPGNLYRYFPSKDALVAGLCERDRVGLAQEFAAVKRRRGRFPRCLPRSRPPPLRGQRNRGQGEALPGNLGRSRAQPRDRQAAGRLRPHLRGAAGRGFRGAPRQQGAIHPDVNTRAVASIIGKLGDGLFVRRASRPISTPSARSARSSPSSARF